MKLKLDEPFASLWAGQDAFVAVEQLQGEVYRELEARRTLRTEVAGRGYFVKIHRGIGWVEIFKNWLTAKAPVLGAEQEWIAIERLQKHNIATMTAVGFGVRGSNPAQQHSFIITQELAPTISLEDYSMDWPTQPPEPTLKRALIARVAQMVGGMHRAGVNSGEVEPYTATNGRSSAAATCIKPESLDTTAVAHDIKSMACASEVSPAKLYTSSRKPGISH